MKIKEIVKITQGVLISGDAESELCLDKISTDSRAINEGDIFLPLKGKNFNGEEFIDDAFKKGAIGAFVTTQPAVRSPQCGKVIIRVKGTTKALQDIAHANRMKFAIPVIGVTGSNGKTTTKDMISLVLSKKFTILKSEGTKNNHLGLPLTLLKLNNSHQICVVEMGANHHGEIRLLAGIARPTIVVITNIGPSHLEFLKDLNGVFDAKREILEALNRDSTAFLNGDDKYLSKIKDESFKIMRFGLDEKNDFHASTISIDGSIIKFFLNGRSPFELNLIGTHNIYNALAAIAVAHKFGISYHDIKKALSEYAPGSMRLNATTVGGVTVIDDVYNSNPLSMNSALRALGEYPAKRRWVVSADMLELGKKETEFHNMIGEAIAGADFAGLITFGVLSRHTSSRALECGMGPDKVWHCSSRKEVTEILKRITKEGDCVLIKGSRSMKMEEVVEYLKGR